MFPPFNVLLSATSHASSSTISRQDPGFKTVPPTAKPTTPSIMALSKTAKAAH